MRFLFVVLIDIFLEASFRFADTVKNIPSLKVPVIVGNIRQGKTISGMSCDSDVFIPYFFHDSPFIGWYPSLALISSRLSSSAMPSFGLPE